MKPIVAAMMAATAFVACDGSPAEPDGDRQLTLSPDSVVVGVADSSPRVATVRDAGGVLQHVALQYVSPDPRVATVNANGAISAVAAGATVRVHADSCSGARPDFGGVAGAAERALVSYDVTAPLDLQKTVVSTNNGVEVSSISFGSPDGGPVTGMMWDPVTRPGLRPGVVLMHGLPAVRAP